MAHLLIINSASLDIKLFSLLLFFSWVSLHPFFYVIPLSSIDAGEPKDAKNEGFCADQVFISPLYFSDSIFLLT